MNEGSWELCVEGNEEDRVLEEVDHASPTSCGEDRCRERLHAE